jgi:hypothetical protein
VEQVWRHLWNRSIYSDGDTGYLNEDEVTASMLALGFLEDEWGLHVPAEDAPAGDWRTYHIKVWWAQTKSEVWYQLRRPFWRWRRLAAAYRYHRSGAAIQHPWWQYLWK